ncbi:MAG: autotransporter domain-containing protein [Acetobacter sp.]|uniref:autotransporter domain-containing protein n=2 Tax=Acetobacter sp. TaxID=440 RepID=UPI0039E9F0F6
MTIDTPISGNAGLYNNANISDNLTITSSGSLTGTSAQGLYNDKSGQINKLDNEGAITSANSTGVANLANGQIQTFVNNGSISGLNAINNLGTLGAFENGSTGTLTGLAGWSGFSNTGTVTSLTNDNGGIIISNTAAAVNNLGGGQIQTFLNNGSITGVYAVYNAGTLGSFENGSTGKLTGLSGWSGFYNTNTVTSLINDNGGTITGGNTQPGIFNTSSGWITTLDNRGTVTGSTYGVSNAGHITTLNNTGVLSGSSGVANMSSGVIGALNNNGTINGTTATALYNGGKITTLTNGTGARISSSSTSGVYNVGSGQIQTFLNNGSITGGTYAVSNAGTLGSFENGSTGTLTGASGWSGFYNTGSVTTLTNDNGGTITGGYTQSGILNGVGGRIQTFLNNGSITGANAVSNTGTLGSFENGSTGTLTGASGYNAFYNTGTVTSLTNDQGGTITGGAGWAGIFNDIGAQITTLVNNGMITGPVNGIYNGGQITTLENSGNLSGSTAGGILNASTGSVGTINNTGTISGGKYGVNNNFGGTISVLNNYGTITGTLGSINNVGISAMTVNNYGVLNGSVALRAATLNLLASGSPSSSVVNGDITGTSASAITVGDGTNTTLFTANGNASVGTIQVASGSTLALSSGNAWQTSGDVTNNGRIVLNAPGANAGNQMMVGGNYVSSSDSVLRVNGGTGSTGATVTVNGMSAGVQTSDGLQVSGAVTLNGGQVTLTTNGATLKYGQAYEIVSAASGVTGRYDSLNTNLASFYTFLSPSLFYTDNTVDVMLTRNQTTFASVARTRNGGVVAGLLDALPVSSPVSAAVFQLDGQGARSAFNSLSGEIHASARTALVQDSFFVRQSALDRLNSADCDGASMNGTIHTASLKAGRTQGGCQSRGVALWGTAYGSLGHNSGDGNAAAMQHSTAGFVMGADTLVARTWRVGGLVSYGRSMFDLGGDRNSSGHSNNVSIGGYGGTHWGRLNLRLGATYTWDMLSTSRTVALPGLGERLAGSYLGGTAQGFGELSYKLRIAHTVVEPFANVAYVNLHTNGYHEQGGSAALAGKATDTGVTFSTFGGRVSSEVHVRKLTLVPYGSVSYRHAFGLTTPTLREAFAQAGSGSMDIAGVALSTNAAVLDTGLTMRLTDRIDVGLSYIGQYGNQSVESGAKAHCSFKF